jgi:hypothetical protein
MFWRLQELMWSEGIVIVFCTISGAKIRVPVRPRNRVIATSVQVHIICTTNIVSLKLTSFNMPFNMAVHQVHTRVGCFESHGRIATRVDQNGIATNRVRSIRVEKSTRVVSFSLLVTLNDLERKAVNMPGMRAGLDNCTSVNSRNWKVKPLVYFITYIVVVNDKLHNVIALDYKRNRVLAVNNRIPSILTSAQYGIKRWDLWSYVSDIQANSESVSNNVPVEWHQWCHWE